MGGHLALRKVEKIPVSSAHARELRLPLADLGLSYLLEPKCQILLTMHVCVIPASSDHALDPADDGQQKLQNECCGEPDPDLLNGCQKFAN